MVLAWPGGYDRARRVGADTVSYSAATANGSAMAAQDPTGIIMVGSSGDQLDSTGAIDGSGDFGNTWLAES